MLSRFAYSDRVQHFAHSDFYGSAWAESVIFSPEENSMTDAYANRIAASLVHIPPDGIQTAVVLCLGNADSINQ